jgi:hypothetical protein
VNGVPKARQREEQNQDSNHDQSEGLLAMGLGGHAEILALTVLNHIPSVAREPYRANVLNARILKNVGLLRAQNRRAQDDK